MSDLGGEEEGGGGSDNLHHGDRRKGGNYLFRKQKLKRMKRNFGNQNAQKRNFKFDQTIRQIVRRRHPNRAENYNCVSFFVKLREVMR